MTFHDLAHKYFGHSITSIIQMDDRCTGIITKIDEASRVLDRIFQDVKLSLTENNDLVGFKKLNDDSYISCLVMRADIGTFFCLDLLNYENYLKERDNFERLGASFDE